MTSQLKFMVTIGVYGLIMIRNNTNLTTTTAYNRTNASNVAMHVALDAVFLKSDKMN